jgi:hypothetical protein
VEDYRDCTISKNLSLNEKFAVNKADKFKIYIGRKHYLHLEQESKAKRIEIIDLGSSEESDEKREGNKKKATNSHDKTEVKRKASKESPEVICIPSDEENSKLESEISKPRILGASWIGKRWTRNMSKSYLSSNLQTCLDPTVPNNLKQRNRMKSLISKFSLPEHIEEVAEPWNPSLSVKKEWWICLETISTTRCKPWNCEHLFCLSWLKAWWDVTNACPLWKIGFKFIVKLNDLGAEIGREEVEDRKPAEEPLLVIDEYCYCWGSNDCESSLLVWDYWDFRWCHTFWDDLDIVPVHEWFCDECRLLPSSQRRERLLGVYYSDELDEPGNYDTLENMQNIPSEDEEEYDPNNDKFGLMLQERDERRFSINTVNIFSDEVKYEYEESEYCPRRDLRSKARIMGADAPKRSLRKRSLKARMKWIEESDSEQNDHNSLYGSEEEIIEVPKRITRSLSRKMNGENNLSIRETRHRRIISNADLESSEPSVIVSQSRSAKFSSEKFLEEIKESSKEDSKGMNETSWAKK